jgi:hypothetical protein
MTSQLPPEDLRHSIDQSKLAEANELETAEAVTAPTIRSVVKKVGSWDLKISLPRKKTKKRQCIICRIRGHIAAHCPLNIAKPENSKP